MRFFTALLLRYYDNKSAVIRQAGTTVTHQDWGRILVITCIGLKQKHAIQAHGAFCTTWQMSSKLTYNGSLQDKTNELAKLEGKWKFKDIHSDISLQVSWRMEDLHNNCTDWQIAFCVKSTFFSTPQAFSIPRDSHSRLHSSINKNQCLVKTEALPIRPGIKSEVNNTMTALGLQQTLWILIPLL